MNASIVRGRVLFADLYEVNESNEKKNLSSWILYIFF